MGLARIAVEVQQQADMIVPQRLRYLYGCECCGHPIRLDGADAQTDGRSANRPAVGLFRSEQGLADRRLLKLWRFMSFPSRLEIALMFG